MKKQILLPLALIAASLMTGCSNNTPKATPVSDQPPAIALKTTPSTTAIAPTNRTVGGLNYYQTTQADGTASGCTIGLPEKVSDGLFKIANQHSCTKNTRLNGVHSVQYATITPSGKEKITKIYTAQWVDGHMQGKAIVRTVQGKKTVTMKDSQITG